VRHIRVQDSTLEYVTTDGTTGSIPVSAFNVQYEMDSLPTAAVVPALGWTPFSSKPNGNVPPDLTRAICQLQLKVNDTWYKMLEGRVLLMNPEEDAGADGSRLGMTLHMVHAAGGLGGTPNAVRKHKPFGQYLTDVTDLINSASAPFGDRNSPTMSTDDYIQTNFTYVYRIPVLLHAVLKALVTNARPDQLDSFRYVFPDEDVSLPVALRNMAVIHTFAMSMLSEWSTSTAWDALVRTCREYMLHVVPFNDGLVITNPSPAIKGYSVALQPDDITRIAITRDTGAFERIDGVSISTRGTDVIDAPYIVWPPENRNVNREIFMHMANLPPWMASFANSLMGTVPSRSGREQGGGSIEGTSGGSHLVPESIVDAYAQALYSELMLHRGGFTFNPIFRTDLMPGTRIRMTLDTATSRLFAGRRVHGMIARTEYTCGSSGTGSPILSQKCTVAGARTDDENDRIGLESNLLHNSIWRGITLAGDML